MANLPFQISASDDMSWPDLDSAVTPLNMGMSDARDSKTLVPRNHGNPPFCTWEKISCPWANSTPIAATNPIIANRPLILSGAGPLKANTSKKLVLTLGLVGRGGGGGGVSLGEAGGAAACSALISSLC